MDCGHEGLLLLRGTALYSDRHSDRHVVFLDTGVQWRDVDVLHLGGLGCTAIVLRGPLLVAIIVQWQ